jgi:hypothetical protein
MDDSFREKSRQHEEEAADADRNPMPDGHTFRRITDLFAPTDLIPVDDLTRQQQAES